MAMLTPGKYTIGSRGRVPRWLPLLILVAAPLLGCGDSPAEPEEVPEEVVINISGKWSGLLATDPRTTVSLTIRRGNGSFWWEGVGYVLKAHVPGPLIRGEPGSRSIPDSVGLTLVGGLLEDPNVSIKLKAKGFLDMRYHGTIDSKSTISGWISVSKPGVCDLWGYCAISTGLFGSALVLTR